jgi:hypothetical protein
MSDGTKSQHVDRLNFVRCETLKTDLLAPCFELLYLVSLEYTKVSKNIYKCKGFQLVVGLSRYFSANCCLKICESQN